MLTISDRIVAHSLPFCFALSALLGGGVVVAQQPSDTEEAPQVAEAAADSQDQDGDSVTAPSQVDGDSGEETGPPEVVDLELLQDRRKGYLPGEGGYRISEMFGKAHGKFILDYQRFLPNLGVWGGAQNSTGLSGEEGEFSFWEIGAGQQGKIVSGPDTFFTYGGLFNMRDYDFDDVTGVPDMRLYLLFLDIGGGRFVSDDWLIEAHFQPGLATDFGGTITSNQWKWFGELMAVYRANDSLYWKFGGRADDTLRGTPAYPMLGLSWLPDSTWRFDVLAPRYIEAAWSPSAEFTLRGGLSLKGMDYGYHKLTNGTKQNDLDARTQEFRVYLDGVWRAHDLSTITARIGGTVGGNYDIELPADAGHYEGQVESAFFFELLFGASF